MAGCDSAGPSEQDRADAQPAEAEIPLGGAVQISGLSITFDRVIEDSRCPSDVMCIWAGSAAVALTIDGAPTDLVVVPPVDLDHAPEGGARIGDLVVYAVGLTPYPGAETPSDETPVVSIVTVEAE